MSTQKITSTKHLGEEFIGKPVVRGFLSVGEPQGGRLIKWDSTGLPNAEVAEVNKYFKEAVLPPEVTRQASRIKKNAINYLIDECAKLDDGTYLLPIAEKDIQRIEKHVRTSFEREYETMKKDFAAKWDVHLEAAVKKLEEKFADSPYLDHILKAVVKAQPEWAGMEKKFYFNFHTEFIITQHPDEEMQERLRADNARRNKKGAKALIDEVARIAEKAYSELSRIAVPDRRINPKRIEKLRKLGAKVRAMAFTKPKTMLPLANAIEDMVNQFAVGVWIDNPDSVNNYVEIVKALSNPVRIEHCIDNGYPLVDITSDDQPDLPVATKADPAVAQAALNQARAAITTPVAPAPAPSNKKVVTAMDF